MASTLTITDSINFSAPFLQFRPLSLGTNNQPAVGYANIVLQTILGPPFVWRWNRAALTPFNTTAGTQDYVKAVTNFGFLEKASLTAPNGKITEIPGQKLTLSGASDQGRPEYISALIDDNAGNITFRFMNPPNAVYSVALLYQRKPPILTTLTDTWGPVPDEMSYVFNQGFLAFSAMYADDPRWQIELQRFLGSLLGASEGLDELQKQLFLESWQLATGQNLAYQQKVQLAGVSRGSLK